MRKVRSIFAGIVLATVAAGAAMAQNLSGLVPGANISATQALGIAPAQTNRSGPFTIVRFDMPDGNSLSVTADANGRIVFIESDWTYGVSGRFTDIPGFMFGETTLDQIRATMGSNGYCHVATGCVAESANGIVNFNTYGISGTNTAITFITELSLNAAAQNAGGGVSRLVAIILADKSYLNGIWGSETIADENYRDVRFQ